MFEIKRGGFKKRFEGDWDMRVIVEVLGKVLILILYSGAYTVTSV